jgi:hypothetical protein
MNNVYHPQFRCDREPDLVWELEIEKSGIKRRARQACAVG